MTTLPRISERHAGCYEDPRPEPVFLPGWYPIERDGDGNLPPGVGEMKGRFKAVYARRNACVATLMDLETADPGRAELANRILFLTEAIDLLEDACAPVGICAEPVMDDRMFTTELVFTHAPMRQPGGAVGFSSFSLYIPILPEAGTGEEASHAP